MPLRAVRLILALFPLFPLFSDVVEGWECSPRCSSENGFCEKPGKCRCKPGWQGGDCDQCVTFPGCLHGVCHKAWQCLCDEGWVGSLCDKESRLCSARPCPSNATCIDTGEGGYLCICPTGSTGDECQLKKTRCHPNGSPCLHGGSCVEADDSAGSISCLCPPGFSGGLCEISGDSCQPNPCLNAGNCTNHGLAFACVCPLGFTGFTCNDTNSLSPCAGGPCANDAPCVGQPDGTFHCICQKGFWGPTCSLKHRARSRAKAPPPRPADHRVLALAPQHYTLPAHAFHKLLRPSERDLLKITLKETLHPSGVLLSRGQLVCFTMLALLTCLVIVGTAGIVFFGRCETWLANAKYSQLVRQQREHLLQESGGASQEEPEPSVHIILPEKIRLTSVGRHYTSI